MSQVQPAASSAPVISATRLTKIYGQGEVQVTALDGVSVEIPRGQMVALMGPSGSGKSTLMQVLGLLDRPTAGTYLLNGQDLSRVSSRTMAELRGRRIAFVFQSIHLLPRLSALHNVELPMVYARVPAAERRQRATDALNRVGVGALVHRMPNQLSGGQAQRVAIARAVAPGPDLLLADEPTGALDRASGREVLGVFQDLNQSMGLTIVMVTHDPLVGRHAERIIEMEDGRFIRDYAVSGSERLWAHQEVSA